jgi:hypothetical protein
VIPLTVWIAIAALALGGTLGWRVHAWKDAADERDAIQAHQRDFLRREKEQYVAAADHEKARTRIEFIDREVTKEIDRVVEKPVYRELCLDDDGLRLANQAIAATGAASQPGPAVPASGAAGNWFWWRDPAVDQVDIPGLRGVR